MPGRKGVRRCRIGSGNRVRIPAPAPSNQERRGFPCRVRAAGWKLAGVKERRRPGESCGEKRKPRKPKQFDQFQAQATLRKHKKAARGDRTGCRKTAGKRHGRKSTPLQQLNTPKPQRTWHKPGGPERRALDTAAEWAQGKALSMGAGANPARRCQRGVDAAQRSLFSGRAEGGGAGPGACPKTSWAWPGASGRQAAATALPSMALLMRA